MVRDEHTAAVQERARELAEERILDLLIPPAKKPAADYVPGPGFLMRPSPETHNDTEDATEDEMRERTRHKFREMLKRGELDGREVEVEVEAPAASAREPRCALELAFAVPRGNRGVASDQTPMLQVFGPMGLEEMGVNLQDLFGSLGGGKKRKKRRMKIAEAREVLAQEEAQKLIDMDKVTKEALERVQQSGIVFIDEIDKVAARSGGGRSGPDVSREGVQRDLLPIVEGSGVMTKYGMVKTDHILFIASGAFHVAKPSDLIPEMQGRFPIRVELKNLTEEDFYKILTQPKNALLKQYKALLASEGVEIEFTDEAVKEIARIAAEVNEQVENIGARRLHTIVTTLLEDILFDVPDNLSGGKVVADRELVHAKLSAVVENRDLSQYIL